MDSVHIFFFSFVGGGDHGFSSLLDLYNNNMTGELSLVVTQMPNLRHFHLGGNFFAGQIPPEYGRWERLEYLAISGNDLAGTIPSEIGNLTMTLLNLFRNKLHGAIPKFIGELSLLEGFLFCVFLGKISKTPCTFLLPCVASIWIQNDVLSAYTLMGGVAISRLGLWMFDLFVLQQMQDLVPESDRLVVGGVQSSLQSSMDLLAYVMGIVISNPQEFWKLILLSLAAVTVAAILYCIHVYHVSKNLFHFDRLAFCGKDHVTLTTS